MWDKINRSNITPNSSTTNGFANICEGLIRPLSDPHSNFLSDNQHIDNTLAFPHQNTINSLLHKNGLTDFIINKKIRC